jgi:formate hydrogenlyase transcriptional activator
MCAGGLAVHTSDQFRRSQDERRRVKRRFTMTISNLIGTSTRFRVVLEEINMVAPVDCAVLIQGETGTGKEVIARAIHDASRRRNQRFVAVNCAAIPAALLESEFFGHERGAFTCAVAPRPGRFELADRGAMFLDEIGDLPLELQPKLLRVLQEGTIERLGGASSRQVDVRIIAATNRDLWSMVQQGTFRADLYYRLNVLPIALPALRHREEDIPLLAYHFVRTFAARQGKDIAEISNEVLSFLRRHSWPGNIRELQNFIERAVIITTDAVLRCPVQELNMPPAGGGRTLADAERAHIAATLAETNGVVGGRSGAAAMLGLPRTTLMARMQKLGLTSTNKYHRGRQPVSIHSTDAQGGDRVTAVKIPPPPGKVWESMGAR